MDDIISSNGCTVTPFLDLFAVFYPILWMDLDQSMHLTFTHHRDPSPKKRARAVLVPFVILIIFFFHSSQQLVSAWWQQLHSSWDSWADICGDKRNTLPETKSSHLKIDDGKASFLLGWPIFRGELLVSGSVPPPNQMKLNFGYNKTSLMTGESPNHHGLNMWHLHLTIHPTSSCNIMHTVICLIYIVISNPRYPKRLFQKKGHPPATSLVSATLQVVTSIWGITKGQLGRSPGRFPTQTLCTFRCQGITILNLFSPGETTEVLMKGNQPKQCNFIREVLSKLPYNWIHTFALFDPCKNW